MTPEHPSPALQFLTVLWEHKCQAVPPSWRLCNDGMREALHLAIRMGLPFAPQDFAVLDQTCNFGYWATVDNAKNSGEQYYVTAVTCGNRSACRSFEAWKSRKPFFVEGKRLHLGSELAWAGAITLVTSFDDAAHTVTTCAYRTIRRYARDGVHGDGKPIRRYTLTHADLKHAKEGPRA
jgi:hypothetical protein